MAIKIREGRYEDWSSLQKLNREDLGYDIDDQTAQEQLKRVLASDENHLLVAEDERELLGYIHLQCYLALYMGPLANVLGLAVAGKARGKKIGTSLLQEAEKWSETQGFVGVRINSGAERKRAHHFYEKNGYTLKKMQANLYKELKEPLNERIY